MSYRVGLTGGIGSGKSTVARLFEELGVPVIDTDTISHKLTGTGGAAIPAIQSTFGEGYINTEKALDRVKMRELVFSNINAKQQLENILHPLIFAEAKAQAEASIAPYVLLVIPLLFETRNYLDWLHRTVTIDCSEQTQIDRVSKRNGLNEESTRAIMARQFSRAQRKKLADDVINNDGDPAGLREQISKLNQQYLKLASRSN